MSALGQRIGKALWTEKIKLKLKLKLKLFYHKQSKLKNIEVVRWVNVIWNSYYFSGNRRLQF